MLKARTFFVENRARVASVAALFSDEISKDVYLKMVKFRQNPIRGNLPMSICEDAQYYSNEYFSYGDNEVLVDCGAYNGDSIDKFKKAVAEHSGSIKRIVAFEPDDKNYMELAKSHKDVLAFKAGVWSDDGEIAFNLAMDSSARFIVDGSYDKFEKGEDEQLTQISVRAIDNCSECEGVTFLKMDIEGSELPALNGAYNTIKKYKPRLAICIYHSDKEMITIPEWMHENFPEYKLFVRQHGFGMGETVLYGFV